MFYNWISNTLIKNNTLADIVQLSNWTCPFLMSLSILIFRRSFRFITPVLRVCRKLSAHSYHKQIKEFEFKTIIMLIQVSKELTGKVGGSLNINWFSNSSPPLSFELLGGRTVGLFIFYRLGLPLILFYSRITVKIRIKYSWFVAHEQTPQQCRTVTVGVATLYCILDVAILSYICITKLLFQD